jgi:hypothetical protein
MRLLRPQNAPAIVPRRSYDCHGERAKDAAML